MKRAETYLQETIDRQGALRPILDPTIGGVALP